MEELVGKKQLITIIGSGYVGMSLSVLLAKGNNHVKILEVDKDKVKKINDGLSSVRDELIEKYLANDNASVVSFDRLKVGEGIEVETKDFAEEVAEQLK